LAATIVAGASPALAVPISTGTSLAVSYDQLVTGHPDLTGTLDLTVQSITSSQIVLGIDITNTTSALFTSGRLTGLGWDSSVLPTGATDTSSVYNVFLNQNFPANTAVNLCLSSGSTCAGGGSGGLSPLQSNSFTMTLLGNFGTSTLDFSNFAAKFQTAFGSFEPQGTITTTCTGTCGGSGGGTGGGTGGGPGGGSSVPEPSTLSVLGFALLASLGFRFAVRAHALQPIPAKV
jgi:PEP-CTERM motif-containing protein